MNQPPLSPKLAANRIREFLADREDLTGTARRRFLDLLDHYGSFKATTVRRNWRVLWFGSLLIALLGFFLDAGQSSWIDLAIWPACFLLASGSLWFIRRHEKCLAKADGETEWQAYCLFLRPQILADYTGLLDRNLASAASAPNRIVPRPISLARELVRARGPDFWGSCLAGIWGNMIILMVLRQVIASPSRLWSVLLPLAGLLAGPLVWAFGQAAIYFFAQPRADNDSLS